MVSDPKLREKAAANQNSQPAAPPPKPSLPEKPNFGDKSKNSSLVGPTKPYVVSQSDLPSTVLAKFLSLLALGPITKSALEDITHIAHHLLPADLATLYTNHTQIYTPNGTFTQADRFPSVVLGVSPADPASTQIILKDKAYKELRPWGIPWFTEFERNLVIENINNALSRLGYLDTHPLRKRITSKAALDEHQKKPAPPLGGGMLTGRRLNSPQVSLAVGSPLNSGVKRASTQLPRAEPESKRKRPRNDELPLKKSEKALSLSSDDEHKKRHYYGLPNDDDNSDDDMKLLSLKRSPKLPPSASHADKKHQFYQQLAQKFYSRYLEYKELHDELRDTKKGSPQEKKKKLMRLFEMHNTLAQWKRKLWDYQKELSMTQGIMNLLRHKKSASTSSVLALAPPTAKIPSQERFKPYKKVDSPKMRVALNY